MYTVQINLGKNKYLKKLEIHICLYMDMSIKKDVKGYVQNGLGYFRMAKTECEK